MYVDYGYYMSVFQGSNDKETFESLSKMATSLVQQYMEQFIASWDLKKI